MKKTFNIVLIIVMLLGTMFLITGCGRTKFSVDDCLKYMNEKYGEEFTYVELVGRTTRTMEIYVKSESNPNSKVFVVQEITKDGDSFHDNYIAVKYEDETQELLKKLATETYGECKVLYSYRESTLMPDSFSVLTTFNEYISNKASDIYACILLPPDSNMSNKEQDLKLIYEKLCAEKMICNLQVFYVKTENDYNSLTKIQELVYMRDWYEASGYFRMNEELDITKLEWMKPL